MPEKYRNSVIFGSIHGCSIKQNILKPNGSTFTASRGDDFLVSGDKNFRPINLRWGPNGDIYLHRLARPEPVPPDEARRLGLRARPGVPHSAEGDEDEEGGGPGRSSRTKELVELLGDRGPVPRSRTALRLLERAAAAAEAEESTDSSVRYSRRARASCRRHCL